MTSRGTIRIRDLRFWGRHGATEDERNRPQEIELDVEAEADLGQAASSDDLADAVDYDVLYRACEQIVTQRSFALLEALVAACLDAIMADARIVRAMVRARKPRLLDGATPEVELTRTRPPAR